MNKEKQLEEMGLAVLNCYRNKYYTDGNNTEQGIIANAINDVLPVLAELKNGNYRKASSVAEEIFAEIEEGIKAAVSALQFENNPIHRSVKHETYSRLMRFIKSVEQKYTEEGK